VNYHSVNHERNLSQAYILYFLFRLYCYTMLSFYTNQVMENMTWLIIKHPNNRLNCNALCCVCVCVCVCVFLPVHVAWLPPLIPSVPAALSPHVAPSATESCFARQHNVPDNNNQCFSGANGHLPSQLAAQRPGAIDNQSLVNTDPMKASGCVQGWVFVCVRVCVSVCVCVCEIATQFILVLISV